MAKAEQQPIIEVRAQAKYVRCSARKARVVLDTIRGRSVPEARTVLAFSTRDAARDIYKVLHSAVSNAEANHGLVGDSLIVAFCYADGGPTMKRWRARARGRSARIEKKSCHITIRLRPDPRAAADGHGRGHAETKRKDAEAAKTVTPKAKVGKSETAEPKAGAKAPPRGTARKSAKSESKPEAKVEKAAATKAKPSPAKQRAAEKTEEESS